MMEKMENILFLTKKPNTECLNTKTKIILHKRKNQKNSKKKVEQKTVLESKHKCQPSTTSEDEDTETKQSDSVPSQKEKKKLQSNPLLITFINDLIKKCSGYETYFEPGDRRLPKDLVFKICIHRPRPFPDGIN